jgi:LuxR family transcriptional regulator, glucitol operon activator
MPSPTDFLVNVTAKDLGYTLYSRLEEAFRACLARRLIELFGTAWESQVPQGVWTNVQNNSGGTRAAGLSPSDPWDLLEYTYLSDLGEIVCHNGAYSRFFPDQEITQGDFQEVFNQLNGLRCRIAHVRRTFSHEDLEELLSICTKICPLLKTDSLELADVLTAFQTNPTPRVVRVPPSFMLADSEPVYLHLTNLPPADYDMEGGFVGRKEDLKTIRKYITGNLYRVVTVSGAGGVGKTALAHKLCDSFLSLPSSKFPFDALVWVSAKEERLSLTGIDKLDPSLKSYEDLIDAVFEIIGADILDESLDAKEQRFHSLLSLCDKGLLFVVDNLETIQDERLIEFIKEVPSPHKVLITSRLGLGEIEKRYGLKHFSEGDAITLLRCVAREKQLHDLAGKPDDVLRPYVQRMDCYPLAIKWVIGQVALGQDIASVVHLVASPTADLTHFCFDAIFANYLDESDKRVLYSLAVDDRAMTKASLCHLSNFAPDSLSVILQKLTVASLVVSAVITNDRGELETRYELLPLTRRYVYAKLQEHPELHRQIRQRVGVVQNMLEEAKHLRGTYRYSFKEMEAVTEEERLAAMWAMAAHQKYTNGKYQEAVNMFERAITMAPRFPAIYKTWAIVESGEKHSDRAAELMRKAVQIDPDDPGLQVAWAQMEMQADMQDRAYVHLKRALQMAPNDDIIMNLLADCERRRGNYEQAEAWYHQTFEAMKGKPQSRHSISVSKTARADNLRRWSQETKQSNTQAALEWLHQASALLEEVLIDDPADRLAKNTKRDVALQTAHLLFSMKGFEAAKPFYEATITVPAFSEREKRVTQLSSFIMADHLLRRSKLEEARKYLDICKKLSTPGSPNWDQIQSLEAEYSGQRFIGVLEDVEQGDGYGWLRVAGLSGLVRLHRNDFCNAHSVAQFDRLKGRRISVLLADSRAILTARHGRRSSYNTSDSGRSVKANRAIVITEAV